MFLNSRYFNKTKCFNFIFIAIISIITVFSIVSNANIGDFERHFLNSDTLYLPSIYTDVFVENNSLIDFHLNPAPNFFPDMFVHFLLMYVMNGDFVATAIVFALIQLLFIAWLFLKLSKSINNHTTYIGLSLLIIFSFPTIYNNDFLFSFYLIINSYHLGSFVCSLILIIWTYSVLEEGKNKFVLISLFTFASYVSDKSILMNFIAPTLLLLSIFFIKNYFKKQLLIKLTIYILMGLLLGHLFLFIVTNFNLLIIPQTDIVVSLENIKLSFIKFLNYTYTYLLEFSFISLIVFISIVSYILNIFVLFKKKFKVDSFWNFYILIFSSFAIITPILAGKITGLDSIRYNYHILIFLVFIFPYIVANAFNIKIISNKFRYIFISILIIIPFTNIYLPNIVKHTSIYPKDIYLLDKNKDNLNLKNGLATYWRAKKNTMFSKTDIKIISIHSDIKPYTHVTNKKWFYNTEFNFIIADDKNMLDNIKQKLRIIEIKELSENLLVVITKPFIINKNLELEEI